MVTRRENVEQRRDSKIARAVERDDVILIFVLFDDEQKQATMKRRGLTHTYTRITENSGETAIQTLRMASYNYYRKENKKQRVAPTRDRSLKNRRETELAHSGNLSPDQQGDDLLALRQQRSTIMTSRIDNLLRRF